MPLIDISIVYKTIGNNMLYDLIKTIKDYDNQINALQADISYLTLIKDTQRIVKIKNQIKGLHNSMILTNDVIADIIDNQ